MRLLQLALRLDAMVLFLLGATLILTPDRAEQAFQFEGLPPMVTYILAMWGCMFITMALGYAVAAGEPVRHLIWVQVGIARGALEVVLGLIYLSRGLVTWPQAALGIVAATTITVLYLVLYPREPKVVRVDSTSAE